ncbi:pyrroloquinoline quinone biosynthesis protein PqqB [Aliishimia ponticola]|uniref:Coenzyme PQQ synthesis protein B n=1 Tax=Aliishimia ponticola TaxID=2499833 RepID=A0A4S4N9F8_9RHOB|nr:pyrroloquinoline quinone biosynthesis protein PqqB [Aliishimia ponticola]THH35884.1 pyrroloquinoline quinone biosynthesis protein PqqB [Aliishimia ponticola]
MKLVVLGAGAGGGLPQWNCGCQNCLDARAGRIAGMTQSSVAVSPDGVRWIVLNASPDIRAQFGTVAQMHPPALRGTPMAGLVLTNGDIDHIAGLLTLREKTAFDLYATQAGMDILDSNSVFGVLDPQLVARRAIALDTPFTPLEGLTITPFAVPGKVALFLEGEDLDLQAMGEQTIGLLVESGGKSLAYVPGCAALPDWLVAQLGRADLLLFDGTVWENDDMPRTGTGQKTGARMGHVQINGPDGSLARLAGAKGRKVLIHINNTNPILQPDAPERSEVTQAGWEIAFDGMEITL